jgi:hypothetical protein
MRKYLYIMAAATIFASCAGKDTFKKDIQENNEAISFESFTSKQTRATENSQANYDWAFFDHHNTFQVWGFKNTSETAVFTGDVVTVASDGAATPAYTYTYAPIRYWDKAATAYEYYAAAPSGTTGNWTFNRNNLVAAEIVDNAKQHQGYFTTNSTLVGTNITVTDGTDAYKYVNSFKSDATSGVDIDKLVAAPKIVYKAHFSQAVQLNFIHILSRLNVTIKKDEILRDQTVIVKKLEIHNLKATGAFDESKPASQDGDNTRWTESGDAVTYSAPTYKEVTATITSTTPNPDPQYLIQSLVIPQDADHESVALDGQAKTATAAQLFTLAEYNAYFGTNLDQDAFDALSNEAKTKIPAVAAATAISESSKPYLVITYTIQDKRGSEPYPAAEEFTAYFNLAAAFGLDGVDHTGETPAGVDQTKLAFNEGWQNTLHITLSPDAIEFCAQVAEWSTVENELVVE